MLMVNNLAFQHFLYWPFWWLKATVLFILVILPHIFTGQGDSRAPNRWPNATSPPRRSLQEAPLGADHSSIITNF